MGLSEWLESLPWQMVAWLVPCWFLVCYFFSWLSGWHKLAAAYTDRGEFRGERHRHRTGIFGNWAEYENTLTFAVDDEGLRMHVLFFLRPGHPRLFVPWAEITAEHKKSFLGSGTIFTFKRAQGVRLCIADTLAEELLAPGRGKYQVNVD